MASTSTWRAPLSFSMSTASALRAGSAWGSSRRARVWSAACSRRRAASASPVSIRRWPASAARDSASLISHRRCPPWRTSARASRSRARAAFDAVLGFAYFLKRPVAALGFPVQFTAQVADPRPGWPGGPAPATRHCCQPPPAGGGQSGEDNKHDKQRPEAQALLAVKSAVRHGVSLLLLPPAADDPGRSLKKTGGGMGKR